MHVEHFAESQLILIWGSNSIASNLHFWRAGAAGQARGAKLVCIDPRRTETADKCHEHVALLPGTDGALALGLMHELVVNDWLDHDYLAAPHRRLAGAARARAANGRPSAPPQVCGIDAGVRCGSWRATTARIAPAAIRLNYGMQRVRGGGNAVRADRVACRAWSAPGGIAPAGCCCRLRAGSASRATTPRCSAPTCWAAAGRARST